MEVMSDDDSHEFVDLDCACWNVVGQSSTAPVVGCAGEMKGSLHCL